MAENLAALLLAILILIRLQLVHHDHDHVREWLRKKVHNDGIFHFNKNGYDFLEFHEFLELH